MKNPVGLSFVPRNADLGLLLFRAVLGWLVIRYHGWGKLAGWADEKMHLPNLFALDGFRKEFHTFPNYIGISSELSYLFVTWFETFRRDDDYRRILHAAQRASTGEPGAAPTISHLAHRSGLSGPRPRSSGGPAGNCTG